MNNKYIGFDLGVVGGLFIAPSFQMHFGIDPKDKIREAGINGNIVAILQIGCLVGSLAATTTAGNLILHALNIRELKIAC